MLTGIRHKAVLALGCVVVAVVMACGSAAEPSFDKALAALELGQYERAIEDLNEAIRLDPQYANAYGHRGSAYGKLGQYEWAIEDFDEAIRLDPQYAEAYNNRGLAYRNLGQQELADRDFAKAKELEDE